MYAEHITVLTKITNIAAFNFPGIKNYLQGNSVITIFQTTEVIIKNLKHAFFLSRRINFVNPKQNVSCILIFALLETELYSTVYFCLRGDRNRGKCLILFEFSKVNQYQEII